ncbi:unnamed protein product [Rotaria magnacalcarata]|uniref:Uncharacterized protein n=3 Tax=Rotaria magnacalcarata TaxID=392030 RepID=A0A820CLU7_9BILA|nr:unnamed protein product [Rotaria magnacalcarata]CAF3945501.1 unnamed protein product [Rotaria magnacalcarata]CAF4224426.1 unnamed protein product [Rotaria magnacalcarata]
MDKFDDNDLVSLFKRCAYNVVMSAGCNVTSNVNDCWGIGVAKNDYNNDFQQTNFVNSILTSEHDKHIDYITEQPRIRTPESSSWEICPKEQSSYSAMLNISEPVPPPESVPSIPELGQT